MGTAEATNFKLSVQMNQGLQGVMSRNAKVGGKGAIA